jgi:hypothetical protein
MADPGDELRKLIPSGSADLTGLMPAGAGPVLVALITDWRFP